MALLLHFIAISGPQLKQTNDELFRYNKIERLILIWN